MGLLSKLTGMGHTKKGKSKTIKSGEWETVIKSDGTPTHFDKKGKEWLDVYETWAAPSRVYYLHHGADGKGDECIALTTQTEGLRARKFEDGIEAALVTDNGVAYVISDEGNLYTITADRASQKSIADDKADAILLTAQLAAAAVDEGETVIIKVVDLDTGKAWKKAVAYEWPEDDTKQDTEITIKQIDGGLKLTTPDGVAHLFTAAGTPLA